MDIQNKKMDNILDDIELLNTRNKKKKNKDKANKYIENLLWRR